MSSPRTDLPPSAAAFWAEYLEGSADPGAGVRLFGTMRVGDTAESADEGARLILDGTKTATSSLDAEYAAPARPPQPGDLSIVLDGADLAVCIVETTRVARRSFRDVDAAFARDYGEWDRTLAGWREACGIYYAVLCRELGIPWTEDTVLICEHFRVVFRK